MRIVCPSCAARYEIADGTLTVARIVRCSRCAQEWTQEPVVLVDAGASAPVAAAQEPEPMPEAAPDSPVEPAPADPRTGAQPDRTGRRLTSAWIASGLLLAALALLVYLYRAEIEFAWPPSARLLRLLAG